MLSAFLFMVVLGLLLGMVALGVGVGLLVRSIAERSRLHPSIETGAPLDWCWSPTAAARLHRRLQGALAPVYPTRPARRHGGHDRLSELVAVLAQQAGMVDREVIAASRARGPQRRARLRVLRGEVRQIEQLSLRVQSQRVATGAGASPPRQEVLDDVAGRLDLLDAAHAELIAIERASTATDPDELLRRIAPPPPAATVPARQSGHRAHQRDATLPGSSHLRR